MARILGAAFDDAGEPICGAAVIAEREAVDGKRERLGKAQTDDDGSYAIKYSAKTPIDRLVVSLFDAKGAKLADRIIVAPREKQRVSFTVGRDERTRRARLVELNASVDEALGDVSLIELDEAGVARASITSGIAPRDVVALRTARRSARTTGLSASTFFALGAGGSSARLSDVVRQPAPTRRAAIDRAAEEGTITRRQARIALDELDELDRIALAEALKPGARVANPGLAFELAGVAQNRAAILESWRAHVGEPRAFWEKLELDETGKTRLQYALRLGTLTFQHAPLMRALASEFGTLEELASLDLADWHGRIAKHGTPEDLARVHEDDYARAIFARIEAAFPTVMLAARADRFPSGATIGKFLAGAPDYDLAGKALQQWLVENPDGLTPLDSEEERDAVRTELPILERLYKVSPEGARFETMASLRAAGLRSATQIQRLGRAGFIRRLGSRIDRTQAERIYARARTLSGAATVLHVRHGSAVPTSGFASLPIVLGNSSVGEELSGFFGGRTFCACASCQSSHGPAAYLADLLFWLSGRNGGGAHLDALLEARPDLATLELSCRNALTPLPSIDLVNEHLEHVLTGTGDPAERQTTLDEAELRARPEHIHHEAYRSLAEPTPYPFEQPYVLWLDRARTFLGALGVERAALQMTLAEGGVAAGLARSEIAAEVLSMTRASWSLLTHEGRPSTDARWGGSTAGLERVLVFLTRAGDRSAASPLGYRELEDLVRSRYVQDAGAFAIWFGNTVCDIDDAELVSADLDAHLVRIANLLRLRHDLGWSIADVDRATEVFGTEGDPVGERLLMACAAIRWLERRFDAPPAELLSLWGELDTRRWDAQIGDAVPPTLSPPRPGDGAWRSARASSANAGGPDAEPSPLQRMLGSLDDPDRFAILDDGSDFVNPSRPIAEHLDTVSAAVGAEPSEVGVLVARMDPAARLNLENLSRIHREVWLTGALRLDATELIRWEDRTGIDPFASPHDTARFVLEVDRQRAIALDGDDFSTLLGAPGSRALTTLSLPTVVQAAVALSDEHRAHANASVEERRRAILRRTAALLSVEVDLLEGLVALPVDGIRLGDALEADAATVDAARASDPEGLADPGRLAALVDARRWELMALSAWLCQRFDFQAADVRWLVGIDRSIRGFDLGALILGATRADRYAAWAAFREAVRLRAITSDGRIFDLLATFVDDAPSAAELRAGLAERTGWSAESIALAIDDRFGGPLGGTTPADWASPERLGRLASWMNLARRLNVEPGALARWGALVWDPSTQDDPVAVYQTHAEQLEQALRAVWGQARWLESMPELRDGLRERRRAALVSRIVGRPDLPYVSADALGHARLIDTQVGACAKTSRLKDAIRTAQGFVQHVRLGERNGLFLDDEESEEWLWRKSFRVWEANRKVFLYPENWIQPELLADRTPFYAELIDTLAQGVLEESNVEAAYREYLRKLSGLAKLDVLTVIHDPREDGDDVYHIIARDRDVPTAYFHRRWIDRSRWTPWEKIVTAEGDHLIGVVFQRRLVLFWLNIAVNAVQPPGAQSVPSPADTVPDVQKRFQVHLSYSELRDGAWSSPTRSAAYLGVDAHGNISPAGLAIDHLEARPHQDVAHSFDARDVEPRQAIHAAVTADGSDVLVNVFRDRGLEDSFAFGRFRFSGIDQRITAEKVDDLDGRIANRPYPVTEGQRYFGLAQRFEGRAELVLSFALPGTRPAKTARQSVLHVEDGQAQRIQITPTSRAEFDPEDPFVFEDDVASYWVTYDGLTDLRIPEDARFDPELARRGRPGLPPEARERFEERFENAIPPSPPLSGLPREGAHAHLSDAAIESVVAANARVSSVNGVDVSHRASARALSTELIVARSDGTVLDTVSIGGEATDEVEIVTTIHMTIPPLDEPENESPFVLSRYLARYRFRSLSHPHVGLMRETLNRLGVFGLLRPPMGERLAGQDPAPTSTLASRYELYGVSAPLPKDDLDFEIDGAYAQYNWELFFHAPFLIAARLHDAGRYADALEWLRVVFDPSRPAAPGVDDGEISRARSGGSARSVNSSLTARARRRTSKSSSRSSATTPTIATRSRPRVGSSARSRPGVATRSTRTRSRARGSSRTWPRS